MGGVIRQGAGHRAVQRYSGRRNIGYTGSFIAAIDDLKTDPLQGKRLGTLDKHHSKASGVKKKAGLHHSVHRN